MKLSGRNRVIFLRTNRLKCALNKKTLNLHNEESISGEISGKVSKVDEKPRMIEKVSRSLKYDSIFLFINIY